MPDDDKLNTINTKLSAILALLIDDHLRERGDARKDRTIDRVLTDAGLGPNEIGSLLGKTDRAVRKRLASE